MSCVKSLIDANCPNLLRKKQSERGRRGGQCSAVGTVGPGQTLPAACPAQGQGQGQAGQLLPEPPFCPLSPAEAAGLDEVDKGLSSGSK